MSTDSPFAGYDRTQLLGAVENLRADAELYGDITRERFEAFTDHLLHELENATGDEEARQFVAGAFPPDRMIDQLFEALHQLFGTWGAELQEYNTTFVTRGIVLDRLGD